ncbi:hypothetical protein [Paraburkholderia hospita]|uniref:hypothetical protein n=1 Tax=Paraburkholderia hospita TaxID=169430 RepID=UPI001055E8F9|nr:hypothetical protein [Paraburkholderia hospita]
MGQEVFSFSSVALKGAGLIPGLHLFALAADAFFSFGKFVADEGVEASKFDNIPAALLILDLTEKLGIEGG